MPKIGVFIDNNGTYYTCCCRVKIGDEYMFCPSCKKEVISKKERYEFTTGKEHSARRGRAYATYEERQGRADRIAARLRGKEYTHPAICYNCCNPLDECPCNEYSTEW